MNFTPQSVSRILNAAGIEKRVLRRGRIGYMGSEGYRVEKNWKGEVVVNYFNRTGSILTWEQFQPKYETAIAKIHEVLQNKGYTLTQSESGYVVTKVGA